MLTSVAVLAAIALASPSLAIIYGVDSSSLVSEATYAKALSEGFTKAVIRGYEEACSVGGEVDPNFVGSYNNARAAGYTNIDTYWFPCTGSGNACKSFATQIAEIGQTFSNNHMNIGRIWIDFEVDSVYCNNLCGIDFVRFVVVSLKGGQWNYGYSGNLAVAREIVSAIEASGYVWGIYSSPGEWSNMFGSYGVVLDSSTPLWFADYDNSQSLFITIPFGGWSGSAAGHQYTDVSASGLFDLNVFAA